MPSELGLAEWAQTVFNNIQPSTGLPQSLPINVSATAAAMNEMLTTQSPLTAWQVATNKALDNMEKALPQEHFYNKPLNRIIGLGLKQDGMIGLEIECEGTQLFTTPFKYWACHQDNSLRAVKDHQPVEYVLSKPLDPPEIKKALEYLEQKLKQAGSSVVHSNRTSVHVHINCQKLTVRQLYCFILMYIIFEEVLIDWCSPERAGNLFTLRAKDSDYYITLLEAALKQSNFRSWTEHVRYAACNVASIPKFGSLEFRALKGTVDIELITTWINMLLNIMDQSLKYDNPIQIVEEFTQIGPLPFFRKIFSHDKLRSLLELQTGLSGKLWDGLRMMRDVAYTVEWLPPQKKKESTNQEQSQKSLVKAGKLIDGMLVEYRFNDGDVSQTFNVVVRDYSNYLENSQSIFGRRLCHIPDGWTMYYTNDNNMNDLYAVMFDMRPGVPEYADDEES